ncbi:MAG: transporter substrate-binding domain-containing protein [Anaerovorax sp.]|nr:transporter substrate-binding domain-containing protein [Anaerovorax sp.]
MRKLKKILMVILILTLTFAMAACKENVENEETNTGDGSLQRVLDAGKLSVGCEGNWVPYIYNEDGTGELVGFEVEIAKEIASRLGVEADFNVASQWDGVIAGLDAKRYDTVICGTNPNPERKEKYYMTLSYAESPIALVVAKDNTEITGFDKLEGKLCANSLTSSSGQIARNYGAELSDCNLTQAMDLLVTGRADAHVNNLTSIVEFLKEKPDTKVKVAAIYEPENSYEIESAAMFRKEDEELGKEVDKIIQEMIDDGTCYNLAEKYFGKEVADNTKIYQ